MIRCCLGIVLLGPVLFALAQPVTPAPVEVIAPQGNSILSAGSLHVICKGEPGDLIVDGQPKPWGPFAAPLRVAVLRLGPGPHEIHIGPRTLAVKVGEGPPPKGWSEGRLHPITAEANGCSCCHETGQRDALTTVGPVKPSSACLECHRPTEFETKHAHPLEPLQHCASCHSPHGSSLKGLLKAPAKKLCAACHDT